MVRLRSGKGRQHHRTGGTSLRNGECSIYPETHRGTDTACPSRVFLFHRQSATEPSFQQLDIVQLSSPALLSYLQERGINTALAKKNAMRHTLPTTANGISPLPFRTYRADMKSATDISRAASHRRKYHISDNRESREKHVTFLRGSWTTFPF